MNHPEKNTLLVVDDTPENIDVLHGILSADYTVKIANNGPLALKIVAAQPPDLILLDVMMPGMDGYDVCRQLKENEATRHIPVIFVTARGEVADETLGFELGAADYIIKPVSPPIVRARVRAHLALSDQRHYLQQLVAERTGELERNNRQLEETHLVMLQQLGRAADYRDNETGKHIVRVGNFSKLLGLASGFLESQAELLMYASMMHDIGKIGIPDHVLLKPGKLTDEEFDVIKQHPALGAGIVESIPLLARHAPAVRHHHERFDGSGYPDGLRGSDISLAARIIAVADAFDTMTTDRAYRAALSIDAAVRELHKCAGSHFCPVAVKAFISGLRLNTAGK